MKASYIDYQDTKRFPAGLLRYLQQDPSLDRFYDYEPEFDGFEKLLRDKKVNANRQVLVKVLREQYAGMQSPLAASVSQQIDLLSQENTFTISTGHQLNLFTGPLYFIYKIATAIKLAQELKNKFPDKNFVPVYWMATEDHDFEEINHTYIAGKKISWEAKSSGATGRLATETIPEALKSYQGMLGASPNALQLSSWMMEAYEQHSNLAAATRYLVHKLFEGHGLVILDADHPELKKQFSEIMITDIIEQNSFKLISETNQQLKKTGIEAPVNPREINFFYLDEQLRERIVFEEGTYRVLNTEIEFTETELRSQIQNHPEKFSPNVVMRPLYQEQILPNLAYIGGGAEILYWLELKSSFEYYKLDFPILILRNSAQLLDARSAHQVHRLGLQPKYLFQPLDALKKAWILENSRHKLSLLQEKESFKALFEQIKEQARLIDQTLVPSTEAIEVRLNKALQNLEKKLLQAEKRNHEEAMVQLEKLQFAIFHQGELQERSENFGLYFAQAGPAFIDQLIAAFNPLDFKFTVFTLSK
ncbi:MAG: bacillithiol biosynthesis cysteine-adding enzyme BshC [Bacteroidota bacterium]|jgi:bacillithiol biosynthesis cysteine-adding enzyme BshC